MKYTVVHFHSNLPVLRPVTQRVDNAIQQFNYCPVGKLLSSGEVFRKGFVLFCGNKFIFWKALSTLRATGSWRVELIKPLCAALRSRQGHDISICVFKTPCKLYVFLEVTGLRYAFCHLRESSMKYRKKC